MRFYLVIAGAMIAAAQVSLAEIKTVTIGLIGDSTVAEQSGWGPAFTDRFNDRVKVFNYAVNGATLQSLTKRLGELIDLKPDYVLIQFGHNDQKRYGTDVYSKHLKSYVERIRKAGGKPVIVSSVTRRTFDAKGKIDANMVLSEKSNLKGTLTDYARTAQAVAMEMNLPFIDLYGLSIAHHNQIGIEASMTYNWKEGDTTHFNRKGAEAITDLILPELRKIIPELDSYLKDLKVQDAKKNEAGRAEQK
jgi:lysophospholipase L1-like esterase